MDPEAEDEADPRVGVSPPPLEEGRDPFRRGDEAGGPRGELGDALLRTALQAPGEATSLKCPELGPAACSADAASGEVAAPERKEEEEEKNAPCLPPEASSLFKRNNS